MIEGPAQNKMMEAAPAKKGWHFANDGIHKAAYIMAHTIAEAEEIYHKTKEKIQGEQPAAAPLSTRSDVAADNKGIE